MNDTILSSKEVLILRNIIIHGLEKAFHDTISPRLVPIENDLIYSYDELKSLCYKIGIEEELKLFQY